MKSAFDFSLTAVSLVVLFFLSIVNPTKMAAVPASLRQTGSALQWLSLQSAGTQPGWQKVQADGLRG